MSDIVKKLRIAADMRDELKERYWHRASALKREAADRIEFLESELAKTRSAALDDAAIAAYRVCAETRHVTLGDKAAAAIRALCEASP